MSTFRANAWISISIFGGRKVYGNGEAVSATTYIACHGFFFYQIVIYISQTWHGVGCDAIHNKALYER
jgi:hypothetical protein